ncbi:CDP-diacylglycerol--serine O-phosphatidyltransferase [Marinomonas sp. A79]|uniref:CDP-diacylglycerol--serine O-phosphatidyltransferase n=1 Tax=Marinomonas vulgaris TaxID=2823372 RepID=A0ABS5HDC2_9GAMM|nr:CDP-diacylglycerol--serine O-phosphatidyltransferase [Marinomonas vulgaris]MBR7888939.1 CDP-diacylglycerol--serine O-phosphatidyltransferase [Marinomonas vulgaris]
MPIRSLLAPVSSFAIAPDAFRFLHSAAEYRQVLLEMIRKASKRIYLVGLYLEDDAAGREILTAIYEAKQRNPSLDVAVCVDWHRAQRGLIGAKKGKGNAGMYQDFAEQYPHKVPVYGVPVRNREVFGVLHLKGSIFDDTLLYTGASFNNVYLHHQDRYRFDRYHLIQHATLANSMVNFILDKLIQHPAVNDLSRSPLPSTKELRFSIRQCRLALGKAFYQLKHEPLTDQCVAVTPLVGVGRRRNALNNRIIRMLADAKKELVLCTPYFNMPKAVLRELKRALKRGVKVHIIVGDKTANDFYIPPDQPFRAIAGLPYLYEINLRKFARVNQKYIESGVLSLHLWQHDSNSFHLKGLWVDQCSMLLTGHNINPRAWSLDLENGLLIEDPDKHLLAQFTAEYDNIFQHTHRVASFEQLDAMGDYPSKIQRLLKKVIRTRADRLLKRIL